MSGGRQARQIVGPELLSVRAESADLLPRIQAGIVAVVEVQSNRIVPDRFYTYDTYIFLADLQDFLAGPVASNLGGRRVHAQKFRTQLAPIVVTECDLE